MIKITDEMMARKLCDILMRDDPDRPYWPGVSIHECMELAKTWLEEVTATTYENGGGILAALLNNRINQIDWSNMVDLVDEKFDERYV